MESFDVRPGPRLVFGRGALARVGELARAEGFVRTLFVADPGLMATDHAARALDALGDAGVTPVPFSDFGENPDTLMVERGRAFAAEASVDSIIGFGGGSSLDCAKAVNFLLTNGGRMADYWGFGKAAKPLLPMIGVPTTAGTGSEAQCYALVSDAENHVKMACGDPKATFRIALLDPELTLTQPRAVTAVAGYDALSHAVETFVTTKRNAVSELYAREAFRRLARGYPRVLEAPDDVEARAAMQLGAYLAGAAIESSMLGATHACANPLTQRYGTAHGRAIAMCLASVVRFNAEAVGPRYEELERLAGLDEPLADGLERLAAVGGLPRRLREDGVPESDLPELAQDASRQWTGTFNPRAFDAAAALEIYRCAY